MPKLDEVSAKSKARRFKALLPKIERAIAQGARHTDIIEALREEGLALRENTYFTYLRRYRSAPLPQSKAGGGNAPFRATIAMAAVAPAAAPLNTGQELERPPRFDYNPRGIPDLLK